MGVYTRRIKARILYNHLLIFQTPQTHINSLIESGELAKIIDHKNYNPRIIEWMTDVAKIGSLKPEDYPGAFTNALTHPGRLWDIAFRTHIAKRCQHFLFALFFSSEYGVAIESLRIAYEQLHPHLCAKFGEPHDSKDFEEALRILEGGFISVTGREVRFVNPSLRDYLTEYLDDPMMLRDFAAAARQTEWAQAVWLHGKRLKVPDDDALKCFALSFINIATEFPQLPVWKRVRDGYGYTRYATGLSNTNRIELLIAWWEASKDQRFADLALILARAPVDGLDPWRDGDEAVELVGKICSGDYFDELPNANDMANSFGNAVVDMIRRGMSSDELEKISDSVEQWKRLLNTRIVRAVEEAIEDEIGSVGSIVSDNDSESTLSDYIETLEKLAKRTTVSPNVVSRAVEKVRNRIAQVEEQALPSTSPSFSSSAREGDGFNDAALRNLFAPLLVR